MPAIDQFASGLSYLDVETTRPAVYSEAPSRRPGFVVMMSSSPFQSWARAVLDPKSSTSIDAIADTVARTMGFVSKAGPQGLDLTSLSPDVVQGEHLAAVLRCTFKYRSAIRGWTAALLVARQALQAQGADADDALFGLRP